MNLENKRALITGASKRLGKHIALTLAGRGVEILLHYHQSFKEAQDLQKRIEEKGSACSLFKADLSDRIQRKALIEEIQQRNLTPQIVINSASIFGENSIWEWEDEDLMQNMSLHVTAARDLASLLRKETEGAVINMVDCRISDYDHHHIAYHFSKKALFQLTRMLAEEMAPRVQVNAIAPGLILPPPGMDMNYLEERKHSNLLQRAGTPEDISSTVLFLLGNPFITGQTIFVDGGRNLRGSFYG